MLVRCKINRLSKVQQMVILGIFLIAIGGLLLVPKAFSAPVPVSSVTITSEKLDYTMKDLGGFNFLGFNFPNFWLE